jgi:hypothetical protein
MNYPSQPSPVDTIGSVPSVPSSTRMVEHFFFPCKYIVANKFITKKSLESSLDQRKSEKIEKLNFSFVHINTLE